MEASGICESDRGVESDLPGEEWLLLALVKLNGSGW